MLVPPPLDAEKPRAVAADEEGKEGEEREGGKQEEEQHMDMRRTLWLGALMASGAKSGRMSYILLWPIRLEGPEQFGQPADGVDHRARRLGHTRRLSARQVTKLVSEVVEEGVVEVVGRSWGRAEFI